MTLVLPTILFCTSGEFQSGSKVSITEMSWGRKRRRWRQPEVDRREVLGGIRWQVWWLQAWGCTGLKEKEACCYISTGDSNFADFWGFGEISFISICFKEQLL